MRTLLFILFLIPMRLWALNMEVQPVALERVSTAYDLEPGRTYPSCAIFKHRRLQREKVLRELKHSLDKEDKAVLTLNKDSFVTNQYFLDEQLWRDDTVLVTNTWKVSPALIAELQNKPQEVYMWLSGDGVEWRERLAYFPETVNFAYDFSPDPESGVVGSTMVTTHRAYYVDYCGEHEVSQLRWFPQPELAAPVAAEAPVMAETPTPTETALVVESPAPPPIFERLPISSTAEIKMILTLKGP